MPVIKKGLVTQLCPANADPNRFKNINGTEISVPNTKCVHSHIADQLNQ